MTWQAADRRTALGGALALSAGALLSACAKGEKEKPVGASEDMMREHGVLRRILVIYREAAPVLRTAPQTLDAGALAAAADLFRRFGEDYHERQLEEAHVFPRVQQGGGEAAGLIPTLVLQHNRGREIGQFVASRCATGKVSGVDAAPLAAALESFARMYEAHAALEDTIVYQAWRNLLSDKELKESGEQFEAIEKAAFKGDGFDMALAEVARLEQRLGLHDLGRYTAPPPLG